MALARADPAARMRGRLLFPLSASLFDNLVRGDKIAAPRRSLLRRNAMVAQPNSLAGRDVASVIHPYTNLEQHKAVGPTVIARGEGVYVYDDGGKQYLEGMAGLWSTSLGFSEKRLVEAAISQMEKLPTYHIFNGRSNEPMIELAEALLKIAPKGLGQGAVCEFRLGSQRSGGQDRLVLQQRDRPPAQEEDHQPRARLSRHHRVFRKHDGACRPTTMISTCRWAACSATDCPSHYLYGLPGESERAFVDRLVGNLEQMIIREGPDTIAAFIAEPVNGAGGVIVPPRDYFPQRAGSAAPLRHPVHRRRGDHRLWPHRKHVRLRDLRHRARHHDGGEGAVFRLSADLGDDRQREDRRGHHGAFRQARQLRARLHLCRSPRIRGGRASRR